MSTVQLAMWIVQLSRLYQLQIRLLYAADNLYNIMYWSISSQQQHYVLLELPGSLPGLHLVHSLHIMRKWILTARSFLLVTVSHRLLLQWCAMPFLPQ
jgi:hypothetical protein